MDAITRGGTTNVGIVGERDLVIGLRCSAPVTNAANTYPAGNCHIASQSDDVAELVIVGSESKSLASGVQRSAENVMTGALYCHRATRMYSRRHS